MGLFSILGKVASVINNYDDMSSTVEKTKDIINNIREKNHAHQLDKIKTTVTKMQSTINETLRSMEIHDLYLFQSELITEDSKLVDYRYKIPCKYDDISYAGNSYLLAKLYGKYGVLDLNDNIIIPFEYDGLLQFKNGLLPAKKNGKCGYININNETVIDFKYEHTDCFCNGLAPVGIKTPDDEDIKFGYIDTSENFVIPPIYDFAYSFNNNGLAEVEMYINGNFKHGVIDTTGKTILNCNYESINIQKDFVVTEKKNIVDLKGFPITLEGQELVKFFDVRGFKTAGNFLADMQPKDPLNKIIPYKYYNNEFDDFYYGYYINTGSEKICKIMPIFNEAYSIGNDGIAIVKKDGLYGIIKINCQE